MSTSVIRFEAIITDFETTGAGNAFIATMNEIAPGRIFTYQSYTTQSARTVFGYITLAQQAAALAALATLNANIDAIYSPVVCVAMTASTQP